MKKRKETNDKKNEDQETKCNIIKQFSVLFLKLKIINRINGTIHASMDEPNFGVLFTKCRKCFGEVIQNKDAVKCKDCGWFDDRKLSSDFGKADFLK